MLRVVPAGEQNTIIGFLSFRHRSPAAMIAGALFAHHLSAAVRAYYLVTGNSCLVGQRCTALWTNAFAPRTSACPVAAPAAAPAAAAHTSASSRPHPPRARSVTTWHTAHLLSRWLSVYDVPPMPAWAPTDGPLTGLSSPCLNFSTASRAVPVSPT